MTVTWTARCPACGRDALWTNILTPGSDKAPIPDVACSCAVDPSEAVALAVRFLRQGLAPKTALRCLEAAA